jgi:hypothetical protein
MAEQEREVSFGFRAFLTLCEVIVISAILGGAWVMNKTLLAPPLIVAFRLTRVKIEKKFAVLHCATISACMCVSTAICWLGLYLSLPINISLISNIIVGVIFAIITWKIQEVIDMKADYETLKEKLEADKVFNTENCTKDELIARCKELKFSKDNTELAIKFFIDKTKQSTIADELCISEQGVRIKKLRLKKKLNNFNDF